MAIAIWPTCSCDESPSRSGVSLSRETLTRMTAISFSGSRPTSLAATLLLSASVTSRLSAFSTTWLLVRMRPVVVDHEAGARAALRHHPEEEVLAQDRARDVDDPGAGGLVDRDQRFLVVHEAAGAPSEPLRGRHGIREPAHP